MFKWIDRTFVKPVEESKMGLGAFVLIAYGYMLVRDMMEGILESSGLGVTAATVTTLETVLLHFPLFYFMLFFVAAILLRFTTRTEIPKVLRVLLIYSFIILVPPLIDPLLRPGGYRLAYPADPRMIWEGVKAIFGLAKPYYGGSPGMIIEGYLGILLAMIYSGLRAQTTLRKVIAVLLAPLILIGATFFAGGLQLLLGQIFSGGTSSVAALANIYNTGGLISSATRKYALVLLLPLIGVIWLGLWLYNREKVRMLLRSLEPFWLTLSGLLPCLGYLFGWLNLREVLRGVPRNPFDYIALVALGVLGVAAGTANLFFGYSYDVNQEETRRRTYRRAAGGLFLLSILLAWCLGYPALFITIGFFVLALVLYMPPLRLGRFVVTSSLFRALSGFVLMLTGYSLFGTERTLNVLPWQLGLAVFLPLWALFAGWELLQRRLVPRSRKEG